MLLLESFAIEVVIILSLVTIFEVVAGRATQTEYDAVFFDLLRDEMPAHVEDAAENYEHTED